MLSTDSFVSQGVVCSHSVGLGCSWTFTVIIFNDPRGTFVENSRHCSTVLARLPTKQDIPHLSLQLVSQDRAQGLFNRTIWPYPGASEIEFQLCCLWIRFVSQGVVCSHSVGLGCSWTVTEIIFNDPRGSTLFVYMYISIGLL